MQSIKLAFEELICDGRGNYKTDTKLVDFAKTKVGNLLRILESGPDMIAANSNFAQWMELEANCPADYKYVTAHQNFSEHQINNLNTYLSKAYVSSTKMSTSKKGKMLAKLSNHTCWLYMQAKLFS